MATSTPGLPDDDPVIEAPVSQTSKAAPEPAAPAEPVDVLAVTEAANYQQAMADHRPIAESSTEGQ